jgi:HK97 family phage major capsid protein
MKTSNKILHGLRVMLLASIAIIGLCSLPSINYAELADAAIALCTTSGIAIAMSIPAVITQPTKSSKELREERKLLRDQIDAIMKKAESENKRAYTDEESKQLRNLIDQESKLTESIELAQALETRAAQFAAGAGVPANKSEEKEMRNFSLGKLARGLKEGKITGLEKELVEESEKEARELNLLTGKGVYLSRNILNVVQKRTQTAQTGNANLGGNLIPTEKLGFFDALWARMVLSRLGAVSLTGLSSNTDLNGWATKPVAYWAAENGTQSPTDSTIANRALRPKLLGSAVDISMLLKVQTNDSVDAYFLDGMQKAMAVAWEAAVINGDGSNKPTGILGTSGIQSVAMGASGGAPTLAKVLELIQSVQSADADITACKFLTNPKVVAKMKTVPIDTGSGAMLMAYGNYFGGVQNIIDGYPVEVTSNVPSNLVKGSSGAVCSALVFGDFSQVVTAQFGGIEISVDEISAAMRRSGQYGLTINMFVDSAVKQPGALGAIADLTTT